MAPLTTWPSPLRPLKSLRAPQGYVYALENTMKYLRVEVKICEGCGALWLRRGTADGIYCIECVARLASFPAPTGKRAGGRPATRQARLKGCSSGRRAAVCPCSGGAR